ncbi:hypothetical protein PUN4_370110 [Paraburkholderia unamae]|nr:hypothetical protein PUN4_370110 [Paraburkholderia unamae]
MGSWRLCAASTEIALVGIGEAPKIEFEALGCNLSGVALKLGPEHGRGRKRLRDGRTARLLK